MLDLAYDRVVRIELSRLPGQEAVAIPIESILASPDRAQFALSVDPFAVSRGPLHRGRGPAYLLVDGPAGPEVIRDPSAQRRGFRLAVDGELSHLRVFSRSRPDREPRFVAGCGNLGMNAGVRSQQGTLRLGIAGPAEGLLEVRPDGGRRVSEWPPHVDGFVVSGPDLVRGGRVCEPDPVAYGDLRHLIAFPFVELEENRRVDFGEDRLFDEPELRHRAVRGLPVELPLVAVVDERRTCRPVPIDALRRAATAKGYRECSSPSERGTYAVGADAITIVYAEGVYPHHALALRGDGSVTSVLIGGLGSRAGVTVRNLARGLLDEGFDEAVLLDNGGDVGLYDVSAGRFLLRPTEPDRSQSWPLSAALILHTARET